MMRIYIECGQRWWRPRSWRSPRYRRINNRGWAYGPIIILRGKG